MRKSARNEEEIFNELSELCIKPGYAHVIAYLCFRDNLVKYADKITVEDIQKQFTAERLVRTEISTIIGLMCKNTIDCNLPSQELMAEYAEKTEALLAELHYSMLPPISEKFLHATTSDDSSNPLRSGEAIREAIFYSCESAYTFQYRDLAINKYKKDNPWLIANKKFAIEEAQAVLLGITQYQNKKIQNVLEQMILLPPEEWTILPAFMFTVEDIAREIDLNIETITAVVNSFVFPSDSNNESFTALDEFNIANAFPILSLDGSNFLLYQIYSLNEALYESPFYWFNCDKSYVSKAMKNRGDFTEEFSAERLKLVFGNERVFTNVEIVDSKRNKAGEIDVLVVYADRAIVLQAKSKKLTIEARKGNDSSIKDDFKKSVQDSYDQALDCSKLITNLKYKIIDSAGSELHIPRQFKEIYIFCIVSEHYPSLSFQARQFLQYEQGEVIKAPYVMDVFLLDVLTEMLQSPLYFISYINRRTEYDDKIMSAHELTVLSYHLKKNLWIEDELGLLVLSDDISADLDLAMLVRRDGVEGDATPEGILTIYKDTALGRILREIEQKEDTNAIDLGFLILSLNGETIERFSESIDQCALRSCLDGEHHDITAPIVEGKSGLTIHFNSDPIYISAPRLQEHCERRKYMCEANDWFGLCLNPTNMKIRCATHINYAWSASENMKELVANAPKPQMTVNISSLGNPNVKIGRNSPCICGSGKKYKKCCINL